MNYSALALRLLIVGLVGATTYGSYKLLFPKKEEVLYTTKKPFRKTITQIIRATGSLQPEDLLKIGSLVSGTLEKMYVKENAFVKKGQLLARVDDGYGDTQVRSTKAALAQSEAQLKYLKDHFARQKALHDDKFISDDDFEKVGKDLEQAVEQIKINKANLEYAETIFNKKKITAPEDGVIISRPCSEGEAVTNFGMGTVIFTLAKDIRKMEAKIEIDETNVGIVKIGMKTTLSYDTYLGKKFEGTISDLSNNAIEKGGTVSYNATVPVDNSSLLFRPGMTVNAEIVVNKKEKVLSVQGQQFTINPVIVEKIAKIKDYSYKPLSPEQKASARAEGDWRTVWVERNKSFVEQPIKIGLSDGAFFEVLEGLSEDDQVISDTIEENAMDKLFKKFFTTGLK